MMQSLLTGSTKRFPSNYNIISALAYREWGKSQKDWVRIWSHLADTWTWHTNMPPLCLTASSRLSLKLMLRKFS